MTRVARSLAAVVASLSLPLTLPAPAAAEQPASDTPPGGVRTVRFSRPEGSLVVYVPHDVRPRDSISGTVHAEPAGETERERRANLGRLQGYVVAVGDAEAAPAPSVWRWLVPEGAAAAVPIVLRDRRGRVVERATVPTSPVDGPPARTEPCLPRLGQAGRPAVVEGSFDGDLGTSRVSIGGGEATALAESPRALAVLSPVDVAGPTEIVLEEGGRSARGPFRNVGVDLSVGRFDLRPGERTILGVEVTGLSGLDEPLMVTVTNLTPAQVDLGSGDAETFVVGPDEVGDGGTYRWERTLVGRAPGGFEIVADVTTEQPPCPESVAAPAPGPEPGAEPGGPPVQVQQRRDDCDCVDVQPALLSKRDRRAVPSTRVEVEKEPPPPDRRAKVRVEVPYEPRITCETDSKGECETALTARVVSSDWWHRTSNGAWGRARIEVTGETGSTYEPMVTRELPLETARHQCGQQQPGGEPGVLVYEATLVPDPLSTFMTFDGTAGLQGTLTVEFVDRGDQCRLREGARRVARLLVDTNYEIDGVPGVNLPLSDTDGDGLSDLYGPAPASPPGGGAEPPEAPCRCTDLRVQFDKTRHEPAATFGKTERFGTGTTAREEPGKAGSNVRVAVTLPFSYTISCEGERRKSCSAEVEVTAEPLDDPTTLKVWEHGARVDVRGGSPRVDAVNAHPLPETTRVVPARAPCKARCPARNETVEVEDDAAPRLTFYVQGDDDHKMMAGWVRFTLKPRGCRANGAGLQIDLRVDSAAANGIDSARTEVAPAP